MFERIAAEVGREDCREMVRDVTYAFLPTRSQSQVPEAESAASTEADAREDSALTAMSVQVSTSTHDPTRHFKRISLAISYRIGCDRSWQ